MTTLPDENIVWKSASGALTLTSHRVRYQTGTGSNMMLISIMLEELASVGLIRSSNIALLVLGAVAAVLGLVVGAAQSSGAAMVIGLVVGGILIALYFATRQTLLAFGSAGSSIRTLVTGMKLPEILQLVEATDAAKNQRSLLLAGRQKV